MKIDFDQLYDLFVQAWVTLTLEQFSHMAQILTAFITVIAVLVSVRFSIKALREVQLDRNLRHKPFVAFEPGPLDLIIKKSSKRKLSGLKEDWLEKELENLVPQDAVFFYLSPPEPGYGCLRNYGAGPALSVDVCWSVIKAKVPTSTSSEARKLRQKLYGQEFNTTPSVPHHILNNNYATITRLPSFILADYMSEIVEILGILEIKYKDIFGKNHKTEQAFRMFTTYQPFSVTITVTFSDLIYSKKDIERLSAKTN